MISTHGPYSILIEPNPMRALGGATFAAKVIRVIRHDPPPNVDIPVPNDLPEEYGTSAAGASSKMLGRAKRWLDGESYRDEE